MDKKQATVNQTQAKSKHNDNSGIANAAGAGVGAVVGAGAGAVLMGMRGSTPADEVIEEEQITDAEDVVIVEQTVGAVPYASSVTDDMTFAQAFSAARGEVGAGGVFHWHGQSYNTFTADEWNSMSHDQQVAFGNSAIGTDIPHSTMTIPDSDQLASSANSAVTETQVSDDPEVEFLGVFHDDESGMNVGAIAIDDTPVAVIDINGDMEFDYMVIDSNNNGSIDDQDTVVNIEDSGLNVDNIHLLASDDAPAISGDDQFADMGPDYSNDNIDFV